VSEDRPRQVANELPRRGRFVASQALIWFVAALLLGAVIARAAVWVEHVRAPLVIFPLVVGAVLGCLLVAVMWTMNIGHRPALFVGAALAAIVAGAGQHYFHYRDYLDARAIALAEQSEKNGLFQQFQEMAPAAPSFPEYMRRQASLGRVITADHELRGAAAWASWAAEGALIVTAAAVIVYLFGRSPYCPDCRSWYRPVRRGRMDGETAARLVGAAGLEIEQPVAAARYRISQCASGCGPARLQLACDDGRGYTRHGEAWLAAAEREEVTRLLDSSIRTSV
jgi:hypothetical protein